MTKTAYFRHALTGKVDRYPENFGSLFPDVLERAEAKDYGCIDCGPKDEPNLSAELADLEPTPRASRKARDDDNENEDK